MSHVRPRRRSSPRRPLFQGVRYGRPNERRVSLRILLVILAVASALTWLIDALVPERAESPPAGEVGPVEVRFLGKD